MCFGGGSGSTPALPAIPAPTPVPTPSDVSPVQTADQRANQVKQLQYGVLSTVKTSGAGLTGQGPDLNTPTAQGQKQTLGGS